MCGGYVRDGVLKWWVHRVGMQKALLKKALAFGYKYFSSIRKIGLHTLSSNLPR